ncbi:MAG: sugar ABC transporter ATP-binding protein [Candidatus Didemnitutus sp.]|nr:sugar ABC transporter ATP-binding protein [Candidatus Didemnitutus sp.]
MSAPEEILSVSGLGKTYTEPVLAGTDLALHAGEVLALTGENGAGKSTLAKIIAGLVAPTAGRMSFLGADYRPRSRTDAERLGVRMVMQELNLVPTLSVAENLFLQHLPARAGWISRARLHGQARPVMAQVGLGEIHPDAPVGELGIGHQQMVEIARNLTGPCRVLILDEPTAMLTSREVELLFVQIARLQRQGVALVYISHRLEELARVAGRVAVLRDGGLVRVGGMDQFTPAEIVRLMVGREVGEHLDFGPRPPGATLLRVAELGRGRAVQDVSFEVRSGEIFGIAGLVGAGRTELLRLIYGADRADSGKIWLGSPLQPARITSPVDAVRAGVALITEDRKGEGLLLPHPVSANVALGNMTTITRRSPLGRWIRAGAERELATRHIAALRVRCTGPAQPVGELSGGNQQKVVIARWLERDQPVMLFDEPTRGIDVGAKFEIYQLLGELSRRGKAQVVVSSDLRELMLVCDRIGVMSAGRMVKIFERGAWSQDTLLAAAFSGFADGAAA